MPTSPAIVAMKNQRKAEHLNVALLLSSGGTAYGGSESYVLGMARVLSLQTGIKLIVGKGDFTADFMTLISSRPVAWMTFPFIPRSSLVSSLLKRTRLHERVNQFDVEALGALSSAGRINQFLAGSDLVEVNYPTESLIFPFLRKQIKKVIHFHGPWLPPLYAHLSGRIDQHVDAYVTCSNWSKGELEKKLKSSVVTVLHNGVDVSIFKPKAPNRLWTDVRYDAGLLKVGTAARLSKAKGIDILFQAAKELKGIAEFFVAGPVEKDFEDTLSSYAKQPHFHVLGPLPNHQMPDFYNFLDCFVLPSLSEAFGISLLEVMACGKPVIASRVGGIPEIVEDRVDGILVPPRNPTALKEAIRTIAQDESLRNTFGKSARQNVLKHFTLEKKAEETRAFYRNVRKRSEKE